MVFHGWTIVFSQENKLLNQQIQLISELFIAYMLDT